MACATTRPTFSFHLSTTFPQHSHPKSKTLFPNPPLLPKIQTFSLSLTHTSPKPIKLSANSIDVSKEDKNSIDVSKEDKPTSDEPTSPPPTSSVDPPQPVPEELETTLDKRRLEEKFAVLNTGVYECRSCGYKYDEAVGDPSYPVPPGLPFDKLPEDWRCPTCGAAQGFFVSKSVEIAGFAQNQQFGLGGNTLTSGQKAVLIFGGLFLFFVLFLSGYFLQ